MGMQLISQAYRLASEVHLGQYKKGKNLTVPYINHCISVADTLIKYFPNVLSEEIIAALLHDTIEDTHITFEYLKKEFGVEIASIILQLTDPEKIHFFKSKMWQVNSMYNKSYSAQRVKLADAFDNTSEMVTNPPKKWGRKKILFYVNTRNLIFRSASINIPKQMQKDFDNMYNNVIYYYNEGKNK